MGIRPSPPNANQPPYGYQGAALANPGPPPLPGGFQPPRPRSLVSGSPVTEPSPNGEAFHSWIPGSSAEEAQTGRILVGVGVNSDAGLVGNIVLDEQNFDWTRWPTSWEDVRNGSALRGGGEDFRIEAVPGTELRATRSSTSSRTWFHLEDRAVSLRLSGVYYTRIYTNGTEAREGGRISLGYQLTHDLTASVAFRGYNVNISNPVVPTPAALKQVLGNNAMYGFEVSLSTIPATARSWPPRATCSSSRSRRSIGSYAYPHVECSRSSTSSSSSGPTIRAARC